MAAEGRLARDALNVPTRLTIPRGVIEFIKGLIQPLTEDARNVVPESHGEPVIVSRTLRPVLESAVSGIAIANTVTAGSQAGNDNGGS